MKQIEMFTEYLAKVHETSLTMQKNQLKKQQKILLKQKEAALARLHHKPGRKEIYFSLFGNIIILLCCIIFWSDKLYIWLTTLLVLDIISLLINCLFLARSTRNH